MREKVINLGRNGLRKHAEIAENAEISFFEHGFTLIYTDYFYKNRD